jgi:pyrroline-5-carboxylate reductase
MSKINIAVLGCGNMAQALVKGMYKSNHEIEFHTYTPSHSKALKLANEVNGISYKNLNEIPDCRFYLIACKPNQVKDLGESIKGYIDPSAIIISILAGTTVSSLQTIFKNNNIIRVMPNTPCLIGEGVNLVYASSSIEQKDFDYIKTQLEYVSTLFEMKEENQIDDFIGVSSSGPAYVFEIARILAKKLQALGLEPSAAKLMTNKVLYGSSKLLLNSEDSAEKLRNKVTSKNGVTFAALETLKEYQLEKAFNEALDNAKKRSIELG